MIKKNENYGKSKNVTIAEFDSGDIIVTDGFIPDNGNVCLMFVNDVPNQIGTDHPERKGKTTDELEQDIIFVFKNAESIGVVQRALNRIKDKIQPGGPIFIDEARPILNDMLQNNISISKACELLNEKINR